MAQIYCRQCQKKVSDCPHCKYPIDAPRVHVFDPKIQRLAYDARERTVEITFKNGQAWQLFALPERIYGELRDTSISSFLKLIAQWEGKIVAWMLCGLRLIVERYS